MSRKGSRRQGKIATPHVPRRKPLEKKPLSPQASLLPFLPNRSLWKAAALNQDRLYGFVRLGASKVEAWTQNTP